ncbi:MAG: alpha-D-glucose phosphate-specific phosphoglucomutase, partial [Deltaproteobacteria bacterium]|nr:alpha-D-glucose phosphate-specific phosphoglucomutase [Deltaproteobacteria bacterium]
LIAIKGMSVREIVNQHWHHFGRNYYSRHDYEEIETEIAENIVKDLRNRFATLIGSKFGPLEIIQADDFSYLDPIDGELSENQGLRLLFADKSRIILRLSGTGTSGATLRLYFEKIEKDAAKINFAAQTALAPLINLAEDLTSLKKLTGRSEPTVIT